MSAILVLCPSHRDHRELPLLYPEREHRFFFHDYATEELERMVSPSPTPCGVRHPDDEIEAIVAAYGGARIDAVISTDDYPGSALASIVAGRMGLPGAEPRANLLCQHKYYSRLAQRAACALAVPDFEVLTNGRLYDVGFPCFIKPVKSFFSIGACQVDNARSLEELARRATLPEAFFSPFKALFEKYTQLPFGAHRVLAEDFLEGEQVTLEGYAFAGSIHTIGIVDSVMFPGTLAFNRFEYPSRLPDTVQSRMAEVATPVMKQIGFDHGLFNIEFMYNSQRDTIHIIEINPRMVSQFADLHEKVDGFNTYAVLVDLALGRAPQTKPRAGKYAAAASCVLRRFRDALVVKAPAPNDVAQLEASIPDIRVEVLVNERSQLSHEMQDGSSYRYGMVNIGGRDIPGVLQIFEYCKRALPFVFADT